MAKNSKDVGHINPVPENSRPEIWGGIECSVIRVQNRFHNQIVASGHFERISDLSVFRELGIRTIRYPILWEMVAPVNLEEPNWNWADERLAKLKELAIKPIVGLVHHGSGPAYTSLLDPEFPQKLAKYAGMVAERYPWVMDYTPVNEPLTTARFSGLYGHWYPHAENAPDFLRCLLNQCKGIILSMQAIRRVSPEARLVTTEDLGKTFSTKLLEYQAEFDNHRRWLSLDLLFGKVDRNHPLRQWLLQNNVTEEELDFFSDAMTPPDIVGLNYYVTSDRLLDERLELYPSCTHGGNGRHHYADVEAARAWSSGISGHGELLESAWKRYKTPVAITEAHLGCTREEQLRWLDETWQAAIRSQAVGVDIRAITAWSLLGAFDWDSLVTKPQGNYESGILDTRTSPPRPTALAIMIKNLATTGDFQHPCLEIPGWWRRPDRFLPTCIPSTCIPYDCPILPLNSFNYRPLLIIGKTGTLGSAFARLCELRGLRYLLLSRNDIDIASPASVALAFKKYRPWAVINAAGFVRVDEAEDEQKLCFRENTNGPTVIATTCAQRGIKMVTFSSDLVFGGEKGTPYIESDPVGPLNVYGRSKAAAESQVLFLNSDALIIRTSAFFGPWDQYNFVSVTLNQLRRGEIAAVPTDSTISPTYVPDLVNTVLDLMLDDEKGIWHISNQGAVSWSEFAHLFADMAKLNPLILPQSSVELGLRAKRPAVVVMSSERATLLPSLDNALQRYFKESAISG